MHFAALVADRAYVLGQVRLRGSMAELAAQDAVRTII
jgi:ABC-type branched-subunit amino acid transport system ATPase component